MDKHVREYEMHDGTHVKEEFTLNPDGSITIDKCITPIPVPRITFTSYLDADLLKRLLQNRNGK